MAFYGLIPDVTQVIISVTAGRPERRETPLGIFDFRHVKPELLRGYRMVEMGNDLGLLTLANLEQLLE